jgi:hypothetical protein
MPKNPERRSPVNAASSVASERRLSLAPLSGTGVSGRRICCTLKACCCAAPKASQPGASSYQSERRAIRRAFGTAAWHEQFSLTCGQACGEPRSQRSSQGKPPRHPARAQRHWFPSRTAPHTCRAPHQKSRNGLAFPCRVLAYLRPLLRHRLQVLGVDSVDAHLDQFLHGDAVVAGLF